ncbi:hypothetical protein JQN72_04800 [Phycicoccus sp. CSK15P-2]|uniref:hypothetical protein n=1 Tax=Phycicoccus sp. CSK15P-2 TaxID=2807627 RepID=UPI0019527EEA|nr:hypothetical protein [Phycicoccus sp. CSK15P-2]MBM6403562.1 hypothetical protein [Phycicoccus sp. CSK15P-2]
MPASLRLALEPLHWSAAFYRRHWPLVAGLSVLVSAERAADQLTGLPQPAAEIATTLVRLALVAYVVVHGVSRDPTWRAASQRPRPSALGLYRRHPGLVPWHLALLATGLVVFDVVPDLLVRTMVAPGDQALAWAVLLAVKNPTVIAFSLLWTVALVRQPLLWSASAAMHSR